MTSERRTKRELRLAAVAENDRNLAEYLAKWAHEICAHLNSLFVTQALSKSSKE